MARDQISDRTPPSVIEKFLSGGKHGEVILHEERKTPYGSVSRSLTRADVVTGIVRPFELRYGMSTEVFIGKYRGGRLPDDENAGDYVEWANMTQFIERKVRQDIIRT